MVILLKEKKMSKTLYGKDAIKAVEKLENRKLSYAEKRVVVEEGFSPVAYLDTKGIKTFGVGQTGEWIDKGFKASFEHHVKRATKKVPKLKQLPVELQAELIQAEYRGDLGESKDAVALINEGKFKEASKEFLDNDDYRTSVSLRGTERQTGIAGRMEKVAQALYNHAEDPIEEAISAIKRPSYEVKSKDTLSSISRQTGTPLEELIKLNNIQNPDVIQSGTKLLYK
jgi:LysM repeat protein|tara:strand:+ start:20 stop:700 length:681 start_codon:yes stop_codon:yes gene_type:complete